MTRRIYVYFILTFLLGAIVGGSAVVFYGWQSGRWHRRPDRQRIVRHLTRELNLTTPQAEQLKTIMDDSFKKFAEQRQQMDPQFKAIHEETTNRIRQILTPEQLTKFNEMVRRFEERRSKKGPPSD
jgi:Spy/CpxP family protein refolding chaperone